MTNSDILHNLLFEISIKYIQHTHTKHVEFYIKFIYKLLYISITSMINRKAVCTINTTGQIGPLRYLAILKSSN